jgi:sugar/nucleoside kinase (ribokinase family)
MARQSLMAARQNLKPKIDILGLGAVAVDDLICVDAYPPADAKVLVMRSERHCGGLTATALVAAARLGCRCAYAGVLGKDELSTFAIARLRAEGIALRWLVQRSEARPIHSFIVVDEGRQTRNVFANLKGFVGADDNWPKAEVIQSARVLFVDHFGLPGMIRAARLAREAGIPVVGDFERETAAPFRELFSLVDHLILSAAFAQKFTGKSNPAAAAKALWTKGRSVVAVTCGEDGCCYVDKSEPDTARHQPAFSVKTVDTTGCGDVFHGAYAAALARGEELPERIRFASATAALKAMKPGGQAGIPTRKVVEEFLQRGRVN